MTLILSLKYHPLLYRTVQRHILEAESFPLQVPEKEKGKKNNNLKEARRDLNSLINEKIEGNLRFTNQKYYENGNRESRLLALRLRKQESSNIVQKLKENN